MWSGPSRCGGVLQIQPQPVARQRLGFACERRRFRIGRIGGQPLYCGGDILQIQPNPYGVSALVLLVSAVASASVA